MNKQLYSFTRRRNTSTGIHKTNTEFEEKEVGLFIPYNERKIVIDDEK